MLLAGCGAHPHHAVTIPPGDEITLYRDVALVRQRVEVDVRGTTATVKLTAAAGLAGDQLVILDRGGLAIRGVHVAVDGPTAAGTDCASGDPDSCPDGPNAADDAPPAPGTPAEIRIDVTAPRAGHYAIAFAYVTDRLRWDAAYTMTTTPAREDAVLRGAIAIRNTTGLVLRRVSLQVVDAELGAWRTRTAEHLATALVGGTPSTTPAAIPRELGSATLGDGETRVALVGIDAPRRMHSVLVYDPIGTKLDNPGAVPARDAALGVTPSAATRITESFEVARDEATTRGLPAGPVRLLERRRDGVLAVLGESRLFDAATRVADVDTIAVGAAVGVVGHRERREFTIDDERRRITEELVITIDNERDHAVGVLVREHLYRGLNWALAFPNRPSARRRKERSRSRCGPTFPPRRPPRSSTWWCITWDP